MNILILNWRDVRHPKSGGAELVTMEHAKGWIRLGHTVTWVTAGYDGAKSNEIVDKVRFVRRAGSLTIYLYVPFFLLLHAHEYDVIVDEVHGFPFFSPLFTGKPVVVFIHEIAGEIWDYMFTFPKNVIGKFLERWYFRLYRDHLFWTDAPSTVDELVIRGISKSQCFAIPCPIVKKSRLIGDPPKRREKNPTYIFVSRVVRMKGIEEVVKAFSFIARLQKTAVLWIVGGGDDQYIRELTMMMRDYGIDKRVTFFGSVSDKEKYDLMGRAHLLLHASVKEGWGLVVLEAASVGTPAIVYNVPGLKDIVQDQKTGVVISNNSPQEMARQAISLYNDKRRYVMFQKNGLIWVKSFSWEDVVKQSLSILIRAKEMKKTGIL
jgi:glycosyltransferase involved in cell wall biosynthesis